jgi:hypothetical protein
VARVYSPSAGHRATLAQIGGQPIQADARCPGISKRATLVKISYPTLLPSQPQFLATEPQDLNRKRW